MVAVTPSHLPKSCASDYWYAMQQPHNATRLTIGYGPSRRDVMREVEKWPPFAHAETYAML
jgi:hypothetical protein